MAQDREGGWEDFRRGNTPLNARVPKHLPPRVITYPDLIGTGLARRPNRA